MDTRDKIVDHGDRLNLPSDAIFVRGYFDPLESVHAERLESLGKGGRAVVVLLADPPDPLLPACSRAELVAGLASVKMVVLSTSETPDGALEVHDETAAHLESRNRLMDHVSAKHGGG